MTQDTNSDEVVHPKGAFEMAQQIGPLSFIMEPIEGIDGEFGFIKSGKGTCICAFGAMNNVFYSSEYVKAVAEIMAESVELARLLAVMAAGFGAASCGENTTNEQFSALSQSNKLLKKLGVPGYEQY